MANPTMTLIASNTVGSGGISSVTFSSIPSTYTDLKLVCSSRTTLATVTDNYLNMNFNGDSGSNYSVRAVYGNGATAQSNSFSAQTNGYVYQDEAAGATANTFSNIEVYITNYAGSTAKSYSNDGVAESNTANATGSRWDALQAGLWSGTAAITSLALTAGGSANFVQYSSFYLYGIKNS